MDDIEKNIRVSTLLDYYGAMLTEKQRNFIELYYNEDLSLAEIAEHESISRQGVRDSIKHGEQILFELEDKLGIAGKADEYYRMNAEINTRARSIRRLCGNNSPAGVEAAAIEKLTEEYKDLL